MYCPKCGAEIPDDASFCQNCGAKIEPQNVPREEKKTEVTEPVPPVEQAEPVKTQNTKKPNGSNKKLIAIIAGVLVVIVLVVVLIVVFAGNSSDSTSGTDTGTDQTASAKLTYITDDDDISSEYKDAIRDDLLKRLGLPKNDENFDGYDYITDLYFSPDNGVYTSGHNALIYIISDKVLASKDVSTEDASSSCSAYEYVDLKTDKNGNPIMPTYKGKVKSYDKYEIDPSSDDASDDIVPFNDVLKYSPNARAIYW